MSDEAVRLRRVTRSPTGPADDALVVEEPLEIRVEGESWLVLMRTPGDDVALAAGWLVAERVVEERADVIAIASVGQGRAVDVRLAGGVAWHVARQASGRRAVASSACGVCGRESIDDLLKGPRPTIHPFAPSEELLLGLADHVLPHQVGFRATGATHAAALVAPDGAIESVREDVGRHNAVDKVVGHRWLADRWPIQDRMLFVTSRAGFEIVHKAVIAGIPFVAAVGGASSLAAELAAEAGVGLVGFLRPGRFTRYA